MTFEGEGLEDKKKFLQHFKQRKNHALAALRKKKSFMRCAAKAIRTNHPRLQAFDTLIKFYFYFY